MPGKIRLNTPTVDTKHLNLLIYGHPKVGKSTFCSQIPNHGYIPVEDGVSHLNVRAIFEGDKIQVPKNFAEFGALAKVWMEDKETDVVVIDTIDELWNWVCNHVSQEAGEDSIDSGSLSYGKGAALAREKLRSMLNTFKSAGKGVVMIGHVSRETIQTGNEEHTKWLPNLPAKPRLLVQGWVDYIGYAFVEEQDAGTTSHKLALQPSKYWTAGGRSLAGKPLPPQIPLDWEKFSSLFKRKEKAA